ncbi:hypothetical protein ABB29_00440 [Pseudoxanthomonas dokdonensis]|uniref:RNA polymerase sigma-70 ECF-like HTH domain-containing protein n=2 Tax=Pseudoxanthomonas dokdonensis TaxID=344882 RepID=A0A0R0D1W5_9GAMM|nr:hypothetical protein ABB29_00440 [Pseudoxanthomonas dokdonensis]
MGASDSSAFDATGNDAVLGTVTRLLVDADAGDKDVWGKIYGLLYQDLHRIARSHVRQQRKSAISPTSLVSETWLRLARTEVAAESRAHLVSLIARAMRYVLIDETRRLLRSKRGGDLQFVSLEEHHDPVNDPQLEQLLALDKALDALAGVDERLAKMVELRYFGGLDVKEIADVLKVTERTVRRDWRKARAFLYSQLGSDDGGALEDLNAEP